MGKGKRTIPSPNQPHVVILGAGASTAAFPNGDKNGVKIPIMKDLISMTGINEIIGDKYIGSNIEDIFSDLSSNKNNADVLKKIEEKIYKYFEQMELPDSPTIYDHLILSLKGKDLIASFNWDPFLFQAFRRHYSLGIDLPKIVFLHGNVAVGFCKNCPIFGGKGEYCSRCSSLNVDSKLLFPIGEKNYDDDPLIKSAWSVLRKCLKSAYMLTIFGYGAPVSDVVALKIFKESWGTSNDREFEEIEIIYRPGISDDEIKNVVVRWEDLIHSHHYGTFDSIYHSAIMQFPRRSCESTWNGLMMCQPEEPKPIPRQLDLQKLHEWVMILAKQESKTT